MTATAVAEDHHRDRRWLTESVAASALERWREVLPTRIVDTWASQVPGMLVVLSGAQLVAAQQAEPYVTAVLAEQDISSRSAGPVVPERLSGVASDGRRLGSLLRSPIAAALAMLSSGGGSRKALAAGLAVLDMIVRTQVADAGRTADWVAATSRRAVTGHVRMTVGRTCPRCAVLAGRWYRWSRGFKRHPRCDCQMVPSQESVAGDVRLDPRSLFDGGRVGGLSEREEEAIRAGADLAQVVNANRGMYIADGRRFTIESTTKRGSGPRVRLMPGQIIAEAHGDRDEAIRLLRFHGYIGG
jgi:hypothetical protein